MNKKLITDCLAALALMMALHVPALAQLPYQDRSLSPQERAADLVGRLTLEEKVSLMINDSPAIPRLGIPAYNWWSEALHGVARNGEATMFPMPIGMASSFDAELLEEVFTAVSDEGRVKYRMARLEGDDDLGYKGLTFWTPNINIFRDPRWGRGIETYGEDPYLTGQLGMAVVRGLQGPREDGTIKAQACAKHYAVHSGPESSRHRFDAVVSERDLRETYLPAFRDLVTKAGVEEVMFAYNRFEGTPCGANKRLLQDILRGEWGYKGLIVSDCGAVSDFYSEGGHGYSKTPAEAAAAAVLAGMDIECGHDLHAIPEAVEEGLIKESDLDESVCRLLAVRFALGQIDFDSPWDSIPESRLCSQENLELSLKMTRESIVLLKNDGILPLDRKAKIVLTGPNAADSVMMWGNYNGFPLKTVTLLDAMRERFDDFEYVPGCPLVSELDTTAFDLDAYLAKFDGAETVVFAGGISPRLEGEELQTRIPGFFGGDRTSIELPRIQKEAVKALAGKGKKVIFVNFSGSAIAFADEDRECSAIVQAWYPGQVGGTALVDVMVGDCNPSGKLAVTFYADDSQLPDFEDYSMAGKTYRFIKEKPLYPFGYGLSYTKFKYRRPRVRTLADGTKALVVKVKNVGKMDGDEIVQMYVSRPDDAEGPVRTLRGFKRVSLKAGKSAKVVIPLDGETLDWWNPQTQRMGSVPGKYTLQVGGSSDASALRTVKYKVKK